MVKKSLISFVTLFLFLNSISSNAEIVKKVEINGNSRISDETIKVYGQLKEPNSNYSKSDLDNILKNLYSTNFFENISLEVKNNILYIVLEEYPVVNLILDIFNHVCSSIRSPLFEQLDDNFTLYF